MPNGEECVGRDFFLSCLRFDWEGYTQLQETEDREENITSRPKHYNTRLQKTIPIIVKLGSPTQICKIW